MEKRLIQALIGILILLLAYSALRPFWKLELNEAVKPNSDEKVILEIEQGESAKSVAKDLKNEGLIKSKASFLRTLEKEELDTALRYGRFVLSPSMTLREIITVLTTQGTGEMALTVLEGWTIQEISAQGGWKELKILKRYTHIAPEYLADKLKNQK